MIDQDIVEPTNLQRIQTATKEDLFHPKAEVLTRKLLAFDPSTKIEAMVDTLTWTNVNQILGDSDLVIDGLDNFRTRYVLNRFAVQHKIPYLFSSSVAQQAHIALLNPPNTACLDCIMPHVTDRFNESCESLGVSPMITGIAGAIGAETAIQHLLGKTSRLSTQMITIDLDGPDVLFTPLAKRDDCSTCHDSSSGPDCPLPEVTMLCGEHTANALPPERMDLVLGNISSNIPKEAILSISDTVVVYHNGPYTISLFRNGRVLIGGVDDERRASEIAKETWEALKAMKTKDIKDSKPYLM